MEDNFEKSFVCDKIETIDDDYFKNEINDNDYQNKCIYKVKI